jgi:hypothetical protein
MLCHFAVNDGLFATTALADTACLNLNCLHFDFLLKDPFVWGMGEL